MIWILRAWNLLCLQDYGNINFLSTQAQLKWVYNVPCIAVCAAVLQLGVLELCSCAVITVRLSACSCSLHTVCTAAALSRGRMKNCRTASRRLQAPVVVFIALVASVAWVWQFRHRCKNYVAQYNIPTRAFFLLRVLIHIRIVSGKQGQCSDLKSIRSKVLK